MILAPVNIDNCQYWYLLSFRSQYLNKNGKCSSYDESLYFTQNEGGELNGFDIERCKCRRELELVIEKQILCQKCYFYITLEFRIDGTPRWLIIWFFATLPNLIQHSPFISFGGFCQPPLLFQTPCFLIHVHSRQW